MKWNDLTMKERSDLMSLFLKAGVGSLSDMKRIYNEGGPLRDEDAPSTKVRQPATSIAGRAFGWITDKLGLTKAPTYTDGYGTVRNVEVPFKDSAQGQELKRIGETAKTAGEISLIGLGLTNPITAYSSAEAALSTLGLAYGTAAGLKNASSTIKKAYKDPMSITIPEYAFAALDAIPFIKGVGNLRNIKLPEINNIKQNLTDLYYELNPKYQRFYHASPKKFDIENFNTGTVFDSGLHVSHNKPLTIFGDNIYKGYMEKPSFRFLDVHTNGAEIANPEYAIKSGASRKYISNSPFSRNVYDYMFYNKAPYNKDGIQYVLENPNGTLDVLKNRPIDLLEYTFPNLSNSDKNIIRNLNSQLNSINQKNKKYLGRSRYPIEDQNKIIDINKKFAQILSNNGYRTGVYGNSIADETIGDSYTLFTPDAMRNTRLYVPTDYKDYIPTIPFVNTAPYPSISVAHNIIENNFKKNSGFLEDDNTYKYPDGGELKPATITEKLGRKWDNLYWQKFRREPKDFSDEVTNIPDCAKWSNMQLRNMGYNIWGDAWTRSSQKVKKVYSGYDGLTKPSEYTYSGYKDYVLGAADNVQKNFNWRDLKEGDIIGMYFRGSPNYQKAFINGTNGEAQTHTGHVVYRKGKPYVAHNVHGDIKLNKAKRILGRKHPYGIVSIYRPYAEGGFLL